MMVIWMSNGNFKFVYYLTLQSRTKNSSQRGLRASLIQFRCTKLVFLISEDGSETSSPRTGSIYFTRYPVLSCEQNKVISLAN